MNFSAASFNFAAFNISPANRYKRKVSLLRLLIMVNSTRLWISARGDRNTLRWSETRWRFLWKSPPPYPSFFELHPIITVSRSPTLLQSIILMKNFWLALILNWILNFFNRELPVSFNWTIKMWNKTDSPSVAAAASDRWLAVTNQLYCCCSQ